MLLVLVLALVVLAAVAEWVWWNLRRIRRGTPGPWMWPVVYVLPNIIRNIDTPALFDSLLESATKHGFVYNVRAPGYGDIMVLAKAADVAYILNDNFDNYAKHPGLAEMGDELFGGGIFAVSGDEWRMQRKAATHHFRVRDIKESVTVFHGVAEELVAALEAKHGEPTDLQVLVQNATLAAFTALAFGQRLAEVNEQHTDFAFHFNRLSSGPSSRIANPFWRLMPWLPSERGIRESARFIDELAQRVVTQSEGKDTLLSPFFELELEPARKKKLLRDVLVNFLVAGRDTTSISLSSALYFLAKHPEVQARLYAEIVDAVGSSAQEPDLNIHLEGRLPLLSAVIKETLRLNPPVPVDPKVALADDVLPSGFQVKAGMVVEWHQWLMSRDPSVWGSDAQEFRPERWLEDNPKLPTTNRPPWCPFQFGPRTCLGIRMATCDLETLLIHLVTKLRFENTGHEPQFINRITLCSKNGIFVRAIKRELRN